MMIRASLAAASAAMLSLAVSAQTVPVPKIWDDRALADWATPVAGLNVRPAHYSSAEYYAAPVENLRTYRSSESRRHPAAVGRHRPRSGAQDAQGHRPL